MLGVDVARELIESMKNQGNIPDHMNLLSMVEATEQVCSPDAVPTM